MSFTSSSPKSPDPRTSCTSPQYFRSSRPTNKFLFAIAAKITPGGKSYSVKTVLVSASVSVDIFAFFGSTSSASISSKTNKSSRATLKLKKPSTSNRFVPGRLFVDSHNCLNSSSPSIPSSIKVSISSHFLRASLDSRPDASHNSLNFSSIASSSIAIFGSSSSSSASVDVCSFTGAAASADAFNFVSSASMISSSSSSSSNKSSISRYT
mmetsp:Transcript_642/g.1282  ORF Transcript_642/g.1282 Transcript_642/m.1282 type:complete len:210 (+) Transcript_642:943-1572(+)